MNLQKLKSKVGRLYQADNNYLCGDKGTQGSPRLVKRGFTLAEVLITLGVIGVVAAVTLPTLVTNIQERVRKEQVRTVKYKLTKATDKMKSLGKIGHYDSTMDFVNELKKHLSIAKICQNNELEKCWPSNEIHAYTGTGATLTTYNPENLKKGIDLISLASGTADINTVGIVTGDGVPMIMVYSPKCSGYDEAKTYTWSTENGNPVTNATTNCISAIFDINGVKGPNKIGQDVRTFNALFGSVDLGTSPQAVGVDICNKMKKKYGFQHCDSGYTKGGSDRWSSALYECDKLGMHLPDLMTLANIANSLFGINTFGPYTIYASKNYAGADCKSYFSDSWWTSIFARADSVICNVNLSIDNSSSISNFTEGFYFANTQSGPTTVNIWQIYHDRAFWYPITPEYTYIKTLCVGD